MQIFYYMTSVLDINIEKVKLRNKDECIIQLRRKMPLFDQKMDFNI